VAAALAAKMVERLPGIQIAGTFDPPIASVEKLCHEVVASQINASRADIVWVGLSTPKQELWMACMRDSLDAPVLIGVGAAFDFLTGRVRQAPRWMQQLGLEWVFRFATEPRRLWRRYLIGNTWFVLSLAAQRLGFREVPANWPH
jgi:N-acetylglucosaminyldiphosphoundecaprenol N-acetyl-beta-D-mannosaminyltransferase